jgi:hypothetical protein
MDVNKKLKFVQIPFYKHGNLFRFFNTSSFIETQNEIIKKYIACIRRNEKNMSTCDAVPADAMKGLMCGGASASKKKKKTLHKKKKTSMMKRSVSTIKKTAAKATNIGKSVGKKVIKGAEGVKGLFSGILSSTKKMISSATSQQKKKSKKGKKKMMMKKKKGGAVCGSQITMPTLSESELAIQQKYGPSYTSTQCGGDGYSVNPSQNIGLMPGIDRYGFSNLPVFCGELTQGMKACQTGGAMENKVLEKLLKLEDTKSNKLNKSNVKKLARKLYKGGNLITAVVAELSTVLAPLGKNALISLIVLLGLNSMGKYSKVKKTQKGGEPIMAMLASTLAPLGLNELLAVASLLLLQYFAHSKKKDMAMKGGKKQKGGVLLELNSILAPLGVNVFGASLLLVFLNGFFQSYYGKKQGAKMQGGFLNPIFANLSSVLAPLGWESFSAVVIIVLLNHLFRSRTAKKAASSTSKKQKGGEIASILTYLYEILMPMGVNVFTTSALLVAGTDYMKKSRKSSK